MFRTISALGIALFVLGPIQPAQAQAPEGAIVRYGMDATATEMQHNVPVTFGAVFARGDIPRGFLAKAVTDDGQDLPVQFDVKARNSDGSLRHAVVTLVLPELREGHELGVYLVKSASKVAGAPISLSDIPESFHGKITLTIGGKPFVTTVRYLIDHSTPRKWLEGPGVTEWLLTGPVRDASGNTDPLINVRFGVRSYGKDRPLRFEVVVENTSTFTPHPKTKRYSVAIADGEKVLFEQSDVEQQSHSRWRKVFWLGGTPDVLVKQDLDYLKKTRVIPNYDPTLHVTSLAIDQVVSQFEKRPHGILDAGIVTNYMPTTGGRGDIGPLPDWAAIYVLTMNPKAYDVTMRTGDLAGSWPVHYRDEKTGRPVSLVQHPQISTHFNMIGKGPAALPIVDMDGYKNTLIPDASHQPSLVFLPYVVSGDLYYLEELQFWTEWNVTGTAPEYRELGDGLVKWDQVRGQAWSLRTLAQAEYITPDDDPMKKDFQHQLKANIDWYNKTYALNPNANKLHILTDESHKLPYENSRGYPSWQDDFFTWSIGYVNQLGDVDASAMLKWKAAFPVMRMTQSCWMVGAPYVFWVRDAPTGKFVPAKKAGELTLASMIKNGASAASLSCGSDEMAAALGVKRGEMTGYADNTTGFPSNMQPGLAAAVDAGVPDAQKAWDTFMARSVKPDYNTAPMWAVVPR